MRYVALLRGINVAGKRIVKMDALRRSFAAAGAKDVATYIQSGNVVFTHARASAAALEKQLATDFGFAIPVVLRTAAELASVIEANPFAAPADHLHVLFLPKAPAPIDVVATKPERYGLVGRDVYLCLPNGIGRSKLAGALMKALPDATARNWRTVQQLHAMCT